MGEFYDTKPAPLIERLAGIEGQSNFNSLLAGIEAGPDTTQYMGALSFSRRKGAIPESLEAYVAQSAMYRLPLMTVVWRAVQDEFAPKKKDWPWIQGAIADAFLLVRTGACKDTGRRAKSLKVRKEDYLAMLKLAHGVFLSILDKAEQEFRAAMRPELRITKGRYAAGERGRLFCTPQVASRMGHMRAGIREYDPEDDPADSRDKYDGKQPGMTDRLGWDDRNAAPSPVKLAQPTTSGDSSENEAEP